jgi:hypothetical protein
MNYWYPYELQAAVLLTCQAATSFPEMGQTTA